jgi:hypothetical protein
MDREKSQVERLYEKLAALFDSRRKTWGELHPMEQLEFVDAVNVILKIMQR